ncbi:MAG: galactonate dehydratase [Streptosporangiales bacterium]|nr:galactonate dehydratase [Streptosporangiales bacterium]MBO0891944.1 galactonate dehydratase [Acidothermales bacterium]
MRIRDVRAFQVPPRWILVRVRTDEGVEGWGEAIVPKRVRAVLGAVADLADVVAGAEPYRVEDLWQRMHRGAFFRSGPVLATAAAAIEQALWDVKGRAVGLPVYEFLGGAVREHVRSYAWIGGDRPSDVVAHAKLRREQGFDAVKMNATEQLDYLDRNSQVDAVVDRVGALRDAFGRDLAIALDFHGRVHRPMLRPLLRALEPFGLMWVEEPLPPGHEDSLPSLVAAAGATPIATGERLLDRWHVRRVLEQRAVDVLQPDVSLTGLSELAKICRMAEAYDVAVAPHCPNGPVSLAASLQVDMACGNIVIQEQSLGLHYNQGYDGLPPGDLLDLVPDPAPLRTVAGRLARPAGPGLGVELDAARIEAAATAWHLPDSDWTYDDGRYAEW